MARRRRRDLPSPAYYHVTCRGVEQRVIFLDDEDRSCWVKLLIDVERRYGWAIHAWVILDNHVHLLVETTQPELSSGMHRLNGLHAMAFNKRYRRVGHLFQNRFESRVVEGDRYLEVVTNYVFENSSRVGLVDWPWRGLGSPAADAALARDRTMLLREGHDRRRFETEPASDRRDQAPRQRGGGAPRRRARSLQRAFAPRGAARDRVRAAAATGHRSRAGRLRGLDRAGRAHRDARETREQEGVPARGTRPGHPPRTYHLRARP